MLRRAALPILSMALLSTGSVLRGIPRSLRQRPSRSKNPRRSKQLTGDPQVLVAAAHLIAKKRRRRGISHMPHSTVKAATRSDSISAPFDILFTPMHTHRMLTASGVQSCTRRTLRRA